MTTPTAEKPAGRLRPPLTYYGGKTLVAPHVAAALPAHRHYVEPFAGSLSVLLAKPPSRMETVNDVDHDLMVFWRTLREHPEALIRACAHTPHSRAEHAASYGDLAELPDLERARRVWVRLSQGRSGTLSPTGWRHYVDPESSSTSMPGYLHAYLDRMGPVAERLAPVSLECRDAFDVIDDYGAHTSNLLYVDPPYLGSTRRRNYRHEMTSTANHRRLAQSLHACDATVVLSGYTSDLCDRELYPRWHRRDIAARTGNGADGGRRVEVLWSNRPFAEHDAPTLFDL